jgi:hypothetical protein
MIVAITLSFVACGTDSPSNVVRKLHTAIEKNDSKAIERLMTPDAAALFVSIGEKASEAVKESGRITQVEEQITGNTASVTVTYTSGETAEFDLVKDSGKWKVTIEK